MNKKQTKYYSVVTMFSFILSVYFQYFIPYNLVVAAGVYGSVYDSVYDTVYDEVYDPDMTVTDEVYSYTVSTRFEDPILPDGDIKGISDLVTIPVPTDTTITDTGIGHEYAVYTLRSEIASNVYAINLETLETKQITNDEAEQYAVEIYGNIIVWQDNRNGNWDIYLYDLDQAKEFRLTDNSANQVNPQIYKNNVVWQDFRNGNWDIYLYNLETHDETCLVNDINNQVNPVIFGNNICWQGADDNHWHVFLYNLDSCTLRRISDPQYSTDNYLNNNPRLSHSKLIWTKFENGIWHLMQYNLTTEKRTEMINMPKFISNPKLYDNTYICLGYQGQKSSTNIYSLSSNNSKTLSDLGIDYNIFGTKFIWLDNTNKESPIIHLSKLNY